MSRAVLLAAAAATIAGCAVPAGAAPVSGRFEGLDLAVAGRTVVGSFREAQGDGPSATCAFTFRGTVDTAGRGTVMASDGSGPARRGTIVAAADKVTLAVPGARDFAGCAMVLMPEIDQGIGFTHTADAAWTSLMRVAAAKSALHAAPAGAAHGYLVRDNVVGVTARRGAWVEVGYHNDAGRTSHGWVMASDLAPVAPAR